MFAGTALSVRLFVCVGLSLFIIYGPYLYVVVCVFYAYNLTVVQEQARLLKFLRQNFLNAPTQVFEECDVQNTPPPAPENENLVKIWDFEFSVAKNTTPSSQPSLPRVF